MGPISTRRKLLAKHIAAALCVERPPIFQFWDDDRLKDIHVIEAADRPQPGVKTFATVGLSEYPLMNQGREFSSRVELVGACGIAHSEYANVIATLAFCVINSGWFCAPGIIFPDVMAMYNLSSTMDDIYFADPFLWDDRLKSTDIDGVKTAWLLAVPVSKAETAYAAEHGSDQLQKLFEQKNIDVYDLNRPSVV